MKRPGRARAIVLGLLGVLLGAGCGGEATDARVPTPQETPADEILRIAERWSTRAHQRGLLSPPSAISVFEIAELSTLQLSPRAGSETLVITEELDLRSGVHLRCRTEVQLTLEVQWGRRKGEPAVQLTRPALSVPRACDAPGHPEPRLERAASAARFVLRSDTLVAVEPALDERVYIPQ